MIVSGKGPKVAVCCGELESVTLNVKGVAETAAIGVPLITPVAGFNVNPLGSVPAFNTQAYGSVPPVAVSANVYGEFTTPLGSAVVVITSGDMIVSVRGGVVVADCCGVPESVTLNVNGVAEAAAEGVPLITPVVGFNVNPAGSVPAINDHV
jgi:stage III sporulation protein SpoIIIAA